jgi:hypothetical protein
LHPQYQISGSTDSAHATGYFVRDFEAEGIAYAYLQAVGFADFNKGFVGS